MSERMRRVDEAGAFEWRPPLDAWSDQLARQVDHWMPHQTLELDRDTVVHEVKQGIETRASWLWHPSVRAAQPHLGAERVRPALDAQFAAWVYANSTIERGTIAFTEPTMFWFPVGPEEFAPGIYSLRELGDKMSDSGPCAIALDVWCDVVPAPPGGSWAADPPDGTSAVDELERQVARYCIAVEWLTRHMPACHAWIAEAVKVVVPLRGAPGMFRSGSSPDLPGLVQLDLLHEWHILEGLVHEAAHLHLDRAEAAAPLVDPGDDARFPSPLLPEPRPLRGIVLAYHALAYICAFYCGVLQHTEGDQQWIAEQYAEVRGKARDAHDVIRTERRRLTSAGRAFLRHTETRLGAFYA